MCINVKKITAVLRELPSCYHFLLSPKDFSFLLQFSQLNTTHLNAVMVTTLPILNSKLINLSNKCLQILESISLMFR